MAVKILAKHLYDKKQKLTKPEVVKLCGAITCPACGTDLLRTETGWCCPRSLGHTKIIGDGTLWRRMLPHLKAIRPVRSTATLAWVIGPRALRRYVLQLQQLIRDYATSPTRPNG